MKTNASILVVTHIAHKNISPHEPIEGPYSSLCNVFSSSTKNVNIFGLPLARYNPGIMLGEWKNYKKMFVPKFLGNWLPVKFLVDIVLTTLVILKWSVLNNKRDKLVVGIDPLSCLPLWILKKPLGYKLVYYCVDYNRDRFSNLFFQRCYELADEWASRFSDETWVICEALKNFKKEIFNVDSYYVPNSVVFDPSIFADGKSKRTGNKIVWTGSLLTDRQFGILFGVLSGIQTKIRTDIEFVFAPTRDHDKFELYSKKYNLKSFSLLRLNSRLEFQKVAATCDVGIALYDEKFGSTEFIEPMKIWDFLLCGLPFIVSSEPSITQAIKDGGVAYFLEPKNIIPKDASLKSFLAKNNLENKMPTCLSIAKKYDIQRQLERRLNVLL